MIKAYEQKIKKLEAEKLVLEEKVGNSLAPKHDFSASFRTALNFLQNPHKIWALGGLELKRIVLKLAFTDKLIYNRETGFQTAKTSMVFKTLQII